MADLFNEDLFLKGLEQRKSTLGVDYVENNLAAADDFTRPFQEAMTAWCWDSVGVMKQFPPKHGL